MARKTKRTRRHSRILVPKRSVMAAPPGTVKSPHERTTTIDVFRFSEASFDENRDVTIDDISALRKPGHVLWVNLNHNTDTDAVVRIGEKFGIHALACEDIVSTHQRPKSEDYESHLYIVVRMPQYNDGLQLEQLSILLGSDFVVTIQERPGDCLEPIRQRLRTARGRVRSAGADYLAYAVIDAVIDNYFPVVEKLSERLEELEAHIINEASDAAIAEVHSIRADLHALRRVLLSTRSAIGFLNGFFTRGENSKFARETGIYLRDCDDHAAQLLDAVNACRDLSSDLMDLHVSASSNRMNEIMKVLTLIATIFIPLGFITGLYGMNFDNHVSALNMPELTWRFGYPFALFLMAAMTVGMLVYFRRKGWLGTPRPTTTTTKASDKKPNP